MALPEVEEQRRGGEALVRLRVEAERLLEVRQLELDRRARRERLRLVARVRGADIGRGGEEREGHGRAREEPQACGDERRAGVMEHGPGRGEAAV